eukprot:365253-Chlamydomonas_euryale.AAC.23
MPCLTLESMECSRSCAALPCLLDLRSRCLVDAVQLYQRPWHSSCQVMRSAHAPAGGMAIAAPAQEQALPLRTCD